MRLSPEEVEQVARAFERAHTDPSPSVRHALGTALAHLRHETTEGLVRRLAQDGNAYVRRAAETTLAGRERNQGRQLEERIDDVLLQIEDLARKHSPVLAHRVRRLGRAYFTYTMSGVTHEVRALLTGMASQIEVTERELKSRLQATPGADRGRATSKDPLETWTKFRTRADRYVAMIEAILAHAKELATPPPTKTQRTSVRTIVEDAIACVRDHFAGRADAPSVETKVDVDHNFDVSVAPHHLDNALRNVVRNAFEAVDGRGRVTITATATPTEVTILVADTGCGIPKEDWRIVFLAGRSTKKGRGGSAQNMGWGLTNAQGAIEDAGGRISVASSVVGKGTTFAIVLPRADPDAEPDADDDRSDDEP